jgi:hypothetical protein
VSLSLEDPSPACDPSFRLPRPPPCTCALIGAHRNQLRVVQAALSPLKTGEKRRPSERLRWVGSTHCRWFGSAYKQPPLSEWTEGADQTEETLTVNHEHPSDSSSSRPKKVLTRPPILETHSRAEVSPVARWFGARYFQQVPHCKAVQPTLNRRRTRTYAI